MEFDADIVADAAGDDGSLSADEDELFEAEADAGALADSVESARANCATLYEHTNHKGSSLPINTGKSPWIGGPWNDHVSSLKVRPGCVFNAYEHKDFKGNHKGFSGNVPSVGGSWNDKISSYTCTC
ncbi:peptidase inhibitor family I36 protein [Nannocystis pusilla]|uniref:peptidase inhibitor family I36 protein n=1 Tax=Nannocystis pusilla TaxID=889268 RepID=UPI003DA64607